MHTILAGPAMQPSPNGGIAPPAIDSILSATLLAPDGFRFWRVGPPLPGRSTARIVARCAGLRGFSSGRSTARIVAALGWTLCGSW
ncbi:Uncharacterised protein [Mycobacterium tuberculosis]|nr:Uncharacterised protein [Mycobacterium tuberculosis]